MHRVVNVSERRNLQRLVTLLAAAALNLDLPTEGLDELAREMARLAAEDGWVITRR
jgi:hypothetical protein